VTDTGPAAEYAFDRYLRYDELTAWLQVMAAAHPDLLAVESYGTSNEGRDLWLATLTDTSAGAAATKPAHWIDANIHSVEVTGGVAALWVIHRLVTGFGEDDTVTRAMRTRTFYVAPRVNPDGVEWALADTPRYRRSSTRAWPWRDAHRAPGLQVADIDGDGRVLHMRIPDPNGAWMESREDHRILRPVPVEGTADGVARYRVLLEGELVDYDEFTVPIPDPRENLDLNRNFPAGWSTGVRRSGDHPLSEPEIDSLVRAIVARPNVCGYNAFHTSAGVLLRPSSVRADSNLPPMDVWVYKQLAEHGTALTGYTAHSVFEDFTWDTTSTMSGASDDWAYEHLGVFAWTTEFWDVVNTVTGTKQSTLFWYTGPTEAEELAVLAWSDANHPEMFVPWHPFDHPQLGPVEIGGWDDMCTWDNPPLALLAAEVRPHADFAIYQALAAPCVEVIHTNVVRLGDDTWRVEAGIANTGWLPTYVSEQGRKTNRVLPLTAELWGAEVIGAPARRELGQLEGRARARFAGGVDGTPDRILVAWTVRAAAGTEVAVAVAHPRAGSTTATTILTP
jgi:hypothetical protein